MRAILATQKPVFQIPFFSLLTASLSRDLISPFPANYFFQLSFSRRPRGGMAEPKKNSFTLCGWRVGRNPPSVRSSICLIGEPAPQAELIGVYIPFHSAVGARFIPRPALHPGRPGEHPIIVTRYRPGIVSALPHRLSPDTLRVTLPPCGWSFLRTHTAYAIASSVTAHRLATQI